MCDPPFLELSYAWSGIIYVKAINLAASALVECCEGHTAGRAEIALMGYLEIH
jgi:hypothetical protein